MREKPILFSAPMVRAILAGTKTQTRRVVKPQQPKPSTMEPFDFELTERDGSITAYTREQFATRCPYGVVGDRLWVKETHAFKSIDQNRYLDGRVETLGFRQYGGAPPEAGRPLRVGDGDGMVAYAAHPTSYAELPQWPGYDTYRSDAPARWRPSIHMPRWASRITLEVTGVRVERLHAITDADARAEGVTAPNDMGHCWPDGGPRQAFADLWCSINGADSWQANPWVWVVSFTPTRREGE